MAQHKNSVNFIDLPEETLEKCSFGFDNKKTTPTQLKSAINFINRVGCYLRTCEIKISGPEGDIDSLLVKFFVKLDENSSANLKEISLKIDVNFFRRISVVFQTVLSHLTKLNIEFEFDNVDYGHPIEYASRYLSNLEQFTAMKVPQTHLRSFIYGLGNMKQLRELKFSINCDCEEEGIIVEVGTEMQLLKQLKSVQLDAEGELLDRGVFESATHPMLLLVKNAKNLADIHIHNMKLSITCIDRITNARKASQSDFILAVYTDKLELDVVQKTGTPAVRNVLNFVECNNCEILRLRQPKSPPKFKVASKIIRN